MYKKTIDTNKENTQERQDKEDSFIRGNDASSSPNVAREVIAEVAKKVRKQEDKIIPTEQLVTFELDKEEYASIITDLREIIKIPDIVPIPGAPEFIRGILNLRGQIIVVVDLEKRFHLKRDHEISPQHIIIAEVEDSVFGILVDEVTGVMRVPQASIKSTPDLITSKIHADYLKGVVILGEEANTKEKEEDATKTTKNAREVKSRLLLLLDIPKMLSEKELLEFGAAVQETITKGT
jgi:purine-binding chemotaxis protein CheW